jgi:hypothetical protein
MAALQELIPASFRGVPFNVPKGTVQSGRFAVVHSYPDSNTRYVEDNGLIVSDFHFDAYVFGPDALSRMRALESALQAVGPGVLQHPTHGRRFVQIGKYTLTHEDTNVGVYHFNIEAHETGPPIFPGLLSAIPAAITSLAPPLIGQMFRDFLASVTMPVTAVTSVTLGILTAATNTVSAAMTTAFGMVEDVRSSVATVSQAADMIVGEARTAVAMLDMFRAPFEDSDVPQATLWTGFVAVDAAAVGILAEAAAIWPETLDQSIRQKALYTFGATIEAAAFVSLADAAGGKKYATSEAVSEDISKLVEIYERVADFDVLTNDVVVKLAEIRTIILNHLAAEQVSLPSVVSIPVAMMPASVLSYMLTEKDTATDVIAGLNPMQCPIVYDGAANVLRS